MWQPFFYVQPQSFPCSNLQGQGKENLCRCARKISLCPWFARLFVENWKKMVCYFPFDMVKLGKYFACGLYQLEAKKRLPKRETTSTKGGGACGIIWVKTRKGIQKRGGMRRNTLRSQHFPFRIPPREGLEKPCGTKGLQVSLKQPEYIM